MSQVDEDRSSNATRDGRVLVLAAPRDAELTCHALRRAGIACHALSCATDLEPMIEDGSGVLIAGEELLEGADALALLGLLARQPPWSDLPLIVMKRAVRAGSSALPQLEGVANVTLVDRPVRLESLLSLVRAALRSRSRQYEVRDLLRRLELADRRKDEFLAMLGHELRNPLAAIRAGVTLLETIEDPRTLRTVSILERQTTNLTRIVDDLLDVSRVLSGKIQLQRQATTLLSIAQSAVSAATARAAGRELTFLCTAQESGTGIYADPVRIEQVVSNLLHNAIKYTLPNGRIEIRLDRRPPSVILSISDDGTGIPEDALKSIFDPFVQVEASIDRSQGGLGLGLALVRRLVELHGGEVSVRSPGRGKGSTFAFSLPLHDVSPSSPPPSRATPGPRDAPCRIVLVDDNRDLLEMLAPILSALGHEVRTAESGRDGLAEIRANRPHVAIVDIGLPDLDGYEIARSLRADASRPYLVAMTGYGQPDDHRRALEAGFDEHLVKPATQERLLDVIGKARR